MCEDNFNTNVFCNYWSYRDTFQGHYGILSLQKEDVCFVVIYAAVFDRDKMEGERSGSVLLHHALPDDLLAEGEGEGVCCSSDLVLCFNMGHVLCIEVIDGHHPVSYPYAGLSCLPARGQLEKREHRARNQVHEDRVFKKNKNV